MAGCVQPPHAKSINQKMDLTAKDKHKERQLNIALYHV